MHLFKFINRYSQQGSCSAHSIKAHTNTNILRAVLLVCPCLTSYLSRLYHKRCPNISDMSKPLSLGVWIISRRRLCRCAPETGTCRKVSAFSDDVEFSRGLYRRPKSVKVYSRMCVHVDNLSVVMRSEGLHWPLHSVIESCPMTSDAALLNYNLY